MSTIFCLRQCIIGRQLDCSSVLHSEKLHVNEIVVLVVLLFDDKFGYNTKCDGTQRQYTLLRQLVKQCTISMHTWIQIPHFSIVYASNHHLDHYFQWKISLPTTPPATTGIASVPTGQSALPYLFPSPSIHPAMPITKNVKPNLGFACHVYLGPCSC